METRTKDGRGAERKRGSAGRDGRTGDGLEAADGESDKRRKEEKDGRTDGWEGRGGGEARGYAQIWYLCLSIITTCGSHVAMVASHCAPSEFL